jgi:hypothetical protein
MTDHRSEAERCFDVAENTKEGFTAEMRQVYATVGVGHVLLALLEQLTKPTKETP